MGKTPEDSRSLTYLCTRGRGEERARDASTIPEICNRGNPHDRVLSMDTNPQDYNPGGSLTIISMKE